MWEWMWEWVKGMSEGVHVSGEEGVRRAGGRVQRNRGAGMGVWHLRLKLEGGLQLGGDGGRVGLTLPLQLDALQQRRHRAVLHHPRLRTQLAGELCMVHQAMYQLGTRIPKASW